MGVAAYNRGSALIRQQIADEARPIEFEMMDRLNALPKYDEAIPPRGPSETVRFGEGHGGWWIHCPKTGFGYWYKTLSEAVRRWDVTIIGHDNGEWVAIPNDSARGHEARFRNYMKKIENAFMRSGRENRRRNIARQ